MGFVVGVAAIMRTRSGTGDSCSRCTGASTRREQSGRCTGWDATSTTARCRRCPSTARSRGMDGSRHERGRHPDPRTPYGDRAAGESHESSGGDGETGHAQQPPQVWRVRRRMRLGCGMRSGYSYGWRECVRPGRRSGGLGTPDCSCAGEDRRQAGPGLAFTSPPMMEGQHHAARPAWPQDLTPR